MLMAGGAPLFGELLEGHEHGRILLIVQLERLVSGQHARAGGGALERVLEARQPAREHRVESLLLGSHHLHHGVAAVRLDELVTTKRTLNLDSLLSDDSTFYGDLFAHVIMYRGVMYLEDGLHRAVRAALQQRPILHARVLTIPDDAEPVSPAASAAEVTSELPVTRTPAAPAADDLD